MDRESLTGGPSSDLTTNSMCVTNRGRSVAFCGVVPAVCAEMHREQRTGSVAQVESLARAGAVLSGEGPTRVMQSASHLHGKAVVTRSVLRLVTEVFW